MLPNAGSPAIGGGTATGAPATDQRGDSRTTGARIDIGSVQVSTPPVLTVTNPSPDYTVGGSPVVIDGGITLSYTGGVNLNGAAIAITGGFLPGDTLNFTDQNNITGAYDNSTGVLTLSGSSSVANYETALGSITYSSLRDRLRPMA